jgi:hypothetical protein
MYTPCAKPLFTAYEGIRRHRKVIRSRQAYIAIMNKPFLPFCRGIAFDTLNVSEDLATTQLRSVINWTFFTCFANSVILIDLIMVSHDVNPR